MSIRALTLHAFLLSISPTVGARPQNCVGAPVLEGFGSWAYSTDCFFTGTGTACFGYPGATFRWSSPWAGAFSIDTCLGDGSDTTLTVASPCGSPSTILGCADDECGHQSIAGFSTQAQAEHRIEVGLFWPNDCVPAGRLTIRPQYPNGSSFCAGDGSASVCPCGNPGESGRGCGNSTDARGAVLFGAGIARVSADTFQLMCTGLPNGTALFFQGDARVASGAGAIFGDGLRCVGGSQVRLAISSVANRAVRHPEPGATSISIGGGITAGDVRHYQIWYRDAASFCTAVTFNLTNGWTTTWTQ